jgi:hypothetical protein
VREKSTGRARLKALAILEGIVALSALAAPLMPSKTGAPFAWPGIGAYVERVLLCFAAMNGILIVLAAGVWIYLHRSKP